MQPGSLFSTIELSHSLFLLHFRWQMLFLWVIHASNYFSFISVFFSAISPKFIILLPDTISVTYRVLFGLHQAILIILRTWFWFNLATKLQGYLTAHSWIETLRQGYSVNNEILLSDFVYCETIMFTMTKSVDSSYFVQEFLTKHSIIHSTVQICVPVTFSHQHWKEDHGRD